MEVWKSGSNFMANCQLALVFSRFQSKSNGSAHIGCAAHMNGLSVRFNDMFADGQAKTGASFVAASGRIRAVKSFKNSLQVFFFNANSVVGDFDQHMFAVCFINAGRNAAILFSVFGCILHQIQQYHPDFFFVGKNK